MASSSPRKPSWTKIRRPPRKKLSKECRAFYAAASRTRECVGRRTEPKRKWLDEEQIARSEQCVADLRCRGGIDTLGIFPQNIFERDRRGDRYVQHGRRSGDDGRAGSGGSPCRFSCGQ